VSLSSPPTTADVRERFVVFACGETRCIGVVACPATNAERSSVGVVIVVGGPQTRVGSHRQFVGVARVLAQAGVPAFRFDYRGMGDSDGAPRTFESIDDDIAAAIDAFIEATRVARIVLWGLCDAATACLTYAPRDARVIGVVALNPWARSPQGEAAVRLKHYYLQRVLSREFWAKLVTGGLRLRRSATEVFDTLRVRRERAVPQIDYLERLHRALRALDRPVLLFLSGRDFTAREFEAWVGADPERGTLLRRPFVQSCPLADADHTFSTRKWHDAVAQRTLRWLQQLA
jgi:uncharacterized protein